jgi:crossover junction endodeoxyribonuclease RusA
VTLFLPTRRPGKDLSAVRLTIPYPPPVSALYRNQSGPGRVKTKRYKTWIRAASNEVMAQRRGHFGGPVTLSLTAIRPDKRRRDLDNLLKASQDLMVHCGVLDDDQQVIKVTAEWGDETVIEVCGAA